MVNQAIKIKLDNKTIRLLENGIQIDPKSIQKVNTQDNITQSRGQLGLDKKIPKLSEKINVEGLGSGFKDVTSNITALSGVLGFALGTGFGGVISALKDSSGYLSDILDIGGESLKLALLPMASFFAGFLKPIMLSLLVSSLEMTKNIGGFIKAGEEAGAAATEFFTEGKVHPESALGIFLTELDTLFNDGASAIQNIDWDTGFNSVWDTLTGQWVQEAHAADYTFPTIEAKMGAENLNKLYESIQWGPTTLDLHLKQKAIIDSITFDETSIKLDDPELFPDISDWMPITQEMKDEANKLIKALEVLGVNVTDVTHDMAGMTFLEFKNALIDLENKLIETTDKIKVPNQFLDGSAVTGGREELIDIITRLATALTQMDDAVSYTTDELNSMSTEELLQEIATLQNRLLGFSSTVQEITNSIKTPFLDVSQTFAGGTTLLSDIITRLATALDLLGSDITITDEEIKNMSFEEMAEKITELQNVLLGFSPAMQTAAKAAENIEAPLSDMADTTSELNDAFTTLNDDGTYNLNHFTEQIGTAFDSPREAMAAYENYLNNLSTSTTKAAIVMDAVADAVREVETKLITAGDMLTEFDPTGKTESDRIIATANMKERADVRQNVINESVQNNSFDIQPLVDAWYTTQKMANLSTDNLKQHNIDMFNKIGTILQDIIPEDNILEYQQIMAHLSTKIDDLGDKYLNSNEGSQTIIDELPTIISSVERYGGEELGDAFADVVQITDNITEAANIEADAATTTSDAVDTLQGIVDTSQNSAELNSNTSQTYEVATQDYGNYTSTFGSATKQFAAELNNIARNLAVVANNMSVSATTMLQAAKTPKVVTLQTRSYSSRDNSTESKYNREA